MPKALIFNPENDLALASGLERFTPPKAAVKLAEENALLPMWWAEPGDLILAPEHLAPQAEELKKRYGLHGSIASSLVSCNSAMPWGWSMHTRRVLFDAGMSESALPSPQQIETIRQLSHRRSTIFIHSRLGTPQHLIPVEAETVEQAHLAISAFGKAMIKLPWSCSGRGVMSSERLRPDELTRRIEGAIHRQKSVIIEPLFKPTAEFSALYFANPDSSVTLRGFSAFRSSPSGAYLGNIVAPQSEIEKICGDDAIACAHRLIPVLEQLIKGAYTGWFGIDMLRHDGGLNPCMELNLRITMGVVALLQASHDFRTQ